jgi:hypothetical protein
MHASARISAAANVAASMRQREEIAKVQRLSRRIRDDNRSVVGVGVAGVGIQLRYRHKRKRLLSENANKNQQAMATRDGPNPVIQTWNIAMLGSSNLFLR